MVDWYNTFRNFFGYFMIVPYVKEKTYNDMVMLNYVFLGLLFLLGTLILYVGMSINKGPNGLNRPLFIVKLSFDVLNYVLFYPIVDLFLCFFRCKADANGIWFHKYYTDVQCYTGNNLIHVFTAVVGIMIIVSFSYFQNIIYFQSRFKTHLTNLKYNNI